jgi:hypothetical protein
MEAQAVPSSVRGLSLRVRLAVVFAVLLVHSLALTIIAGLFAARRITRLPQRLLAWSLLTLGWVGTVVLADWGLCWGLTRFILTLIHLSIHTRSHREDVSLSSFSAPPRPLQPSRASTPFEHHVAHITPSTEPLRPGTSLCPHEALHLQDEEDDELMQTRPYYHAYDPTAPEPVYDPTALARYELERSWARLPTTTDIEQGR